MNRIKSKETARTYSSLVKILKWRADCLSLTNANHQTTPKSASNLAHQGTQEKTRWSSITLMLLAQARVSVWEGAGVGQLRFDSIRLEAIDLGLIWVGVLC